MPEFFYDEKCKVAIEFEAHSEDSVGASSYTFSAQAFGAAADGRYIVAALSWMSNAGDRTISSVTIGGVSATILVEGSNAGRGCAICIALVPTGTSGNVVLNLSGACLGATSTTYRVTGILASAAASTATSAANNPTATMNIAANGGLIAIAQARAGAAPTTLWTGAVEDCDDTYVSFNQRSSASDTNDDAVSSLVVTATFTATLGSFGVFATFEP